MFSGRIRFIPAKTGMVYELVSNINENIFFQFKFCMSR